MASDPAAGAPPPIRILAVEDEFLLSAVLQDDLSAAGYTVLGPYGNLARAMEGSRQSTFDIAILDINLGGTMVYPLADDLVARQIPFLFLTGYARGDIPERFANAPRVSKPYEIRALLDSIERCLAASGRAR